MTKILLQAGHQNTTTGATGAPEEMGNNIRIRDRLSQILISKGFVLTLADANYSSNEHFDLALAMHCDANYAGDEGGGFVACADPSVDSVWTESDRIRDAIDSLYFNNSGIRRVQSRENPNTLYYYWWYNLSLNTPCVLIEMGESIDPHDKVILADTDRVCNALARGICVAFNVPFDSAPPPTPPSTPPPVVTPDYKPYLVRIKDILYGKGYFWVKLANIKKVITESGV
jgi:hypothetical protein